MGRDSWTAYFLQRFSLCKAMAVKTLVALFLSIKPSKLNAFALANIRQEYNHKADEILFLSSVRKFIRYL